MEVKLLPSLKKLKATEDEVLFGLNEEEIPMIVQGRLNRGTPQILTRDILDDLKKRLPEDGKYILSVDFDIILEISIATMQANRQCSTA
jgi:hypothetical protein